MPSNVDEVLAHARAVRAQMAERSAQRLYDLENLPAIPPQTNFMSDFGKEFVDQASFNTIDQQSGGGVGSTLGRAAGGFANAATLTTLLGLTPFAPEVTIPTALGLAGFLGGGSLEARNQYNQSGTITNPGAVLGQGSVEGILNLIPGSKAASFGRRLLTDVPVQTGAALAGDYASQVIKGQPYNPSEAGQSGAMGAGMGVLSALLGGGHAAPSNGKLMKAPDLNVPVAGIGAIRQQVQGQMSRPGNVKVDPRLGNGRFALEEVDSLMQQRMAALDALTGSQTPPVAPTSVSGPQVRQLTGSPMPLLTGARTLTTADGMSQFSVEPGPQSPLQRLAEDAGVLLKGQGRTERPPVPGVTDAEFRPVESTSNTPIPGNNILQGEVVDAVPPSFLDENGERIPSTVNSPTAQQFKSPKAVRKAAKNLGLDLKQVEPIQVAGGKWMIHQLDAPPVTPEAAQAPKLPVVDYVGLGPKPKVEKNPTALSTVIADSLSGDRANQDALVAHDFLRDMGLEPTDVARENNSLPAGKQFTVKVAGKAYKINGNESLTTFIERNKLDYKTLARSVRSKNANLENLMRQLPDGPEKIKFLEHEGAQAENIRGAQEHEYYSKVNEKANAAFRELENVNTEAQLDEWDAKVSSDPELGRLAEDSELFQAELGNKVAAANERIQRIKNGEYNPGVKAVEDVNAPESQRLPDNQTAGIPVQVDGTPAPKVAEKPVKPAETIIGEPGARPIQTKPASVDHALRGLAPENQKTVFDHDLTNARPGQQIEGLGKFQGWDGDGLPIISRKGGGRPGESGVAYDTPSLQTLFNQGGHLLNDQEKAMIGTMMQDVEQGLATQSTGFAKHGRGSGISKAVQSPETAAEFGTPANDRILSIEYKQGTNKTPEQIRAIVVNEQGNTRTRIIKEAGNPDLGYVRTGSAPLTEAHMPAGLEAGVKNQTTDANILATGKYLKALDGTPYANHPAAKALRDAASMGDAKSIETALRYMDRLPAEARRLLGQQSGCIK